MKISLTTGISLVFMSFITVLFLSVMNFQMAIQRVNDYHYATVHEIESSDFSPYIISQRQSDSVYSTTITEKSSKEDLRIYEVKTEAQLSIPILRYTTTYTKSSTAR